MENILALLWRHGNRRLLNLPKLPTLWRKGLFAVGLSHLQQMGQAVGKQSQNQSSKANSHFHLKSLLL